MAIIIALIMYYVHFLVWRAGVSVIFQPVRESEQIDMGWLIFALKLAVRRYKYDISW